MQISTTSNTASKPPNQITVCRFSRNQLCRSKVYCRTAGDREGELHDLLDKLMTKTQKLSESSVGLYYFRYNSLF